MRLLLSLLLCFQLTGATYYIDYVSGSDANAGTSTGAPWKHCPSMEPFSGSYSHADGDVFVFKGGVTWPNAALPLYITVGGASGNPDIYRSDASWYSGGSWTRPVFDAEGSAFVNHTSVNYGNLIRIYGANSAYILISDLEMTGWLWDNKIGAGIADGSCVYADTTSNITVSNIYAHDWVVATNLDARMGGPLAYNSSALTFRNSTVKAPTTVDAAHVTETGAGRTSGSGCTWWNNVISNVIIGTTQGTWGGSNVVGNIIMNGGYSYDLDAHENGFWLDTPAIYYNNTISNWTQGVTGFVLPGWGGQSNSRIEVFNNVFYNGLILHLDPSGNVDESNEIVFANNVLDNPSGAANLRIGPGTGSDSAFGLLLVQNNILINTAGAGAIIDSTNYLGSAYTNSNNLLLTTSEASTGGISISNDYYNESTTLNIIEYGTEVPLELTTADRAGTSRPQGTYWDIGTYEYTSGGGPEPETPSSTGGTITIQTLTIGG